MDCDKGIYLSRLQIYDIVSLDEEGAAGDEEAALGNLGDGWRLHDSVRREPPASPVLQLVQCFPQARGSVVLQPRTYAGVYKSVNGWRTVGAGVFPVGVGSLDKQSGKAQMNPVGLGESLNAI